MEFILNTNNNYPNTHLSEADTRAKLITPALHNASWLESSITHEYSYTQGRIEFANNAIKRGKRKKADYLLKIPNTQINLAIIEAKSSDKHISEGLFQAMNYAKDLHCPFAYASNGSGFIEYDFFTGQRRELTLNNFPTPSELTSRYYKGKGLNKDQINITQTPYYLDKKMPRYYQANAINAVVEAVAKGQKRILLVMATGTGKTYTAFQIAYILYRAKIAKKILYLADRNILIDQTLKDDFEHFKKYATKITNHNFDSSYEIYFGIYQQFISADAKSGEQIAHYKQENGGFAPSFFDLIFIDECHRGSVNEDSQWKEILEYFSPAIQIGLTATPKHKEEGSNLEYFGEPIYTYSLKQGIADGFLAPYKVIRAFSNLDIKGYRPEAGKRDKDGELIPDELYLSPEFNRKIYIDERTKEIAKYITQFLHKSLKDPYARTIVFCEDTTHALDMKDALMDLNADLMREDSRYIVRITGDDNEGKEQLENFISNKERYPVIATTSKLLTTGVDTKMAKLIVIDKNISSMSEFKQIIGRGTRLEENKGKSYFVILDFKGASRLFADPDFDGENFEEFILNDKGELLYSDETKPNENPLPPDTKQETNEQKHKKIFVNGVECYFVYESEEILDAQGRLITSDFKDFSKKSILQNYASLKDFLAKWQSAKRKSEILEQMESQGICIEELRAKEEFSGLDEFDIILSLAFNQTPLTRKERAKKASKILNKYEGKAREILEILLQKYAKYGITDIENPQIFKNAPLSDFGDVCDIVAIFGGVENYKNALNALENELYESAS